MINNIFTFFLFFSFFACSTSKKADYMHYCVKDDPSSLRIIPKSDPFIPKLDSLKSNVTIVAKTLKGFESQFSKENVKSFTDKIQELDNITYIKISVLNGYYLAFRARPCDDKAYNDYIVALNSLSEKLITSEELKSELPKIINGENIDGNSELRIISNLSKYINRLK
jgi:hypothetical protein